MSVWRVSAGELFDRKRRELADVGKAALFLVVLLGGSVAATIAIIGPFAYLAVERPALCVRICCGAAAVPCLVWVVRHPLPFLRGLLDLVAALAFLALSLAVGLAVVGATFRSPPLGFALAAAVLLGVNYLAIALARGARARWRAAAARMLHVESYGYVVLLLLQAGWALWRLALRCLALLPGREW